MRSRMFLRMTAVLSNLSKSAFPILFTIMDHKNLKSLKKQGHLLKVREFAKASVVTGQFPKVGTTVSSSLLQIKQISYSTTSFFIRFCLVGREFVLTFYIKFFTLPGTFNFKMVFQRSFSSFFKEVDPT